MSFAASCNRKIEVLVSPMVADHILDVLATDYFPNYAVVAWVSEVAVVRGKKYDPIAPA